MKFFCYTLGDETEPLPPPTPELMAEMDAFVQEAMNKGVLLQTGAFAPSSDGAIVALDDGKFTVTDGPFAEAKELIGGWGLIDVADKDEAIYWVKRVVAMVGGGTCRIRPVFGPDDGPPPTS